MRKHWFFNDLRLPENEASVLKFKEDVRFKVRGEYVYSISAAGFIHFQSSEMEFEEVDGDRTIRPVPGMAYFFHARYSSSELRIRVYDPWENEAYLAPQLKEIIRPHLDRMVSEKKDEIS